MFRPDSPHPLSNLTLFSQIGVIAILENIEDLLQRHGNDYRPKRTVLVAFGHDEEVAGLVRMCDGQCLTAAF